MKLVVLGSNGYRPSDLGQTACYAIPELGITLDAGTGMYRLGDYYQAEQLDVYLSHYHHDHVWGLAYLEFAFLRKRVREAIARGSKTWGLMPRFDPPGDRRCRVRVHLAPEQLEDVQGWIQRFPGERRFVEFTPLKDAYELAPDTMLTSFPVEHRKDESCFGFRIDRPGGSLAYVTDTYGEPGASYVDKIQGVDVLLHDCSVPDDEPDFARRVGHSHITPVAQLAAEAQVGRLVLIHLSAMRPDRGEPELDRGRAIFPRTELAFDRMEIEF